MPDQISLWKFYFLPTKLYGDCPRIVQLVIRTLAKSKLSTVAIKLIHKVTEHSVIVKWRSLETSIFDAW